MQYAWFLISGAILAEISAAILLRNSDGFSHRVPGIAALLAFGAAFYLVSLSLVHLPVSTVYPIWAGGGTAGVAIAGVLFLKERKHVFKAVGVSCVVVGIVLLNWASTSAG